MSVIIRGMKMPTERAWVDVRIFRDGTAIVTEERARRINRQAIELPPHGDLIDRDAFMKKDVPVNGYWDENDGRFHCYPPTYMQAVDDIRAAPTIIPAEEGCAE